MEMPAKVHAAIIADLDLADALRKAADFAERSNVSHSNLWDITISKDYSYRYGTPEPDGYTIVIYMEANNGTTKP